MNVNFHKITSCTFTQEIFRILPQNFTCVITILVKFDIHFLELPWEILFGVTTDDFPPRGGEVIPSNGLIFMRVGSKTPSGGWYIGG